MKRHPFDLVSFVPGVLAVGIAVLALADGLTVDLLATDWVWPAVLVGLGLLVLASAGIGRRAPVDDAPQPPDAPTGDAPAGDAPAGDAPAADAPAEGTSAGDAEEEWPAG